MDMSAEYRSKFAALHVIVTSPYERKILDWDENHKQQTYFDAGLTIGIFVFVLSVLSYAFVLHSCLFLSCLMSVSNLTVCLFETGDAYLKEFYPEAMDNMHTNFGALGGFTVSFVVFTIIAFEIRGIPNLN